MSGSTKINFPGLRDIMKDDNTKGTVRQPPRKCKLLIQFHNIFIEVDGNNITSFAFT